MKRNASAVWNGAPKMKRNEPTTAASPQILVLICTRFEDGAASTGGVDLALTRVAFDGPLGKLSGRSDRR